MSRARRSSSVHGGEMQRQQRRAICRQTKVRDDKLQSVCAHLADDIKGWKSDPDRQSKMKMGIRLKTERIFDPAINQAKVIL